MASSAILPSPASGGDGLFREMLSKPIPFGDPIPKTSLAFSSGTKEVVMGPRSPPSSSSWKGKEKRRIPLVSVSSLEGEGEDEDEEGRNVNGQVNGHGNGYGKENDRSFQSTAQSSSQLTLINQSQPQPLASSSSPAKLRIHKDDPSTSTSTPSPRKTKAKEKEQEKEKGLYPSTVDLSWPEAIATHRKPAAGLYNPSMACYANATLQVLLHTPPVLSIALAHEKDSCLQQQRRGFCMLCVLHEMAEDSHWSGRSHYPSPVLKSLGMIKKGFNKNRQEDTHEFFRFVTDALQATALGGLPKDLPEKIKHTSWVYRVWGGKIRSRVVCSRCNKPSDTFDDFLDLSLDVNKGKKSVQSMMAGFTREDRLEGDNKYHCENCKAKAVATKSFRIQQAPPILTLHLKRFSVNFNSYNGRARADKFNQFIEFGEKLDIAPYMVNPNIGGTTYRLFGVTCHRGNELRFGHYTSYVRHPLGKWFHADDEDMTPVQLSTVLGERTAYLLSYIRVADGANFTPNSTPLRNGLAPVGNGNGSHPANSIPAQTASPLSAVKRKRSRSPESDEELPKAKREGFIGPRVPSSPAKSTGTGTPKSNGHRTYTKTQAEEEEEESDDDDNMPPELPSSKFSYQPKPKPSPIIHAPTAIHPAKFYPTQSPIARPTGPGPTANRSKSQKKKDRKKEKRRGPPMPYNAGQSMGNALGKEAGPMSRQTGVLSRMQGKGGSQQGNGKSKNSRRSFMG